MPTGIAEFETLTLEYVEEGIAALTINRPDRMNSMTSTMFIEIGDAARAIRATNPRAVILTGAGTRVFCSGYDLSELPAVAALGVREFYHFEEVAAGAMAAVRAISCPVIAAIHGGVVGGGLALALAADVRLGAPTAKFAAGFVRIGLSVGELGTSWLLTRLLGPGLAAELSFTGRNVEADEALRIGLLNRIVPANELMDAAIELARQISANSPSGVRLSKTALRLNAEVPSYAAAMELENRGQALLTRTIDMPEALAAFGERRPAKFTGN
jgi:enoyl-CoA hydratase/carnithine racemase